MRILDNPFAIANELLHIIEESNDFLYLVSPYIQFETEGSIELKLIKDAIFNALRRDIDFKFMTQYPNKKVLSFLEELVDKGCRVRFIQKLHSKIYCNESRALIASMNIILKSILNNKEIGVVLINDSEPHEYKEVVRYVEELAGNKYYNLHRKHNIIEDHIVYVLKLENNKWYVGKTSNLEKRLEEHEKGDRSPWTKLNKVINVEETIKHGDLKSITLDYMRKYGWENVRGYAWSQWNMKRPPKELR